MRGVVRDTLKVDEIPTPRRRVSQQFRVEQDMRFAILTDRNRNPLQRYTARIPGIESAGNEWAINHDLVRVALRLRRDDEIPERVAVVRDQLRRPPMGERRRGNNLRPAMARNFPK